MKDSSYILHFYFSLFFIKRSNSISYLTNLCIRLEQFRIICIGYDFCGFTGVLISFKSFFFFQTITPFELDYFFGLNQLKLEIQKLIQESLSKRFSFVLVVNEYERPMRNVLKLQSFYIIHPEAAVGLVSN